MARGLGIPGGTVPATGPPSLAATAFLLRFNMVPDLLSLKEKLVVEHRGEALEVGVESVGPVEEHTYRVTLPVKQIDRVEVHIAED